MIEKIKNLMKENKYEEAAELAEHEIHRIETGDLITRQSEYYNELIGLRISANTLANKTDDLILFTTWKHKYPYSEKIEFSVGGAVCLTDENITFLHSDAYINSFHKEKYFDYNQRSFSNTILKELGHEEIQKQLEKLQNNSLDYFIIEHSIMSAPFSYNIPIVEADNSINLQTLKNGILSALLDAKKKQLSKVSIAALGMEVTPEKTIKEEIIKTIAETLEEFFIITKGEIRPEIYFPFITVSSFNAFSEVFKRYSEKGKYFSRYHKEINETQSKLRETLRTKNPKMLRMIKSLSYVINEKQNILFLGETGTGKSFLAEELHKLSDRKDKPFRSLNCAQVTPEQLFTLVFGWAPHVFPNSPQGGASLFEEAEDGTVFLDEIGYTNVSFQRSLLTFLDKGEYTKIGDKKVYKSTSRLIFGTNQNLEKLIEKQEFMHDLYERLTSYRVFEMIPLRERREDLEEIFNTERDKFNSLYGTSISYDSKALELLISYNWPGNYRQLLYYIQKKFFDLIYERKGSITFDTIKDDPPRNHSVLLDNKLDRLENSLLGLLKSWDFEQNGKFLEAVIKPMLAKIYLEDLRHVYNKTDSNKILGIDGDRGGSKIEQYAKEYIKVKKLLK